MKKHRTRNKKPFRKTVLIYCDGLTEKNYLHDMQQDKFREFSFTIEPRLGANDKFERTCALIEQELTFPNDEPYSLVFYLKDMDTIMGQYKLRPFPLFVDGLGNWGEGTG